MQVLPIVCALSLTVFQLSRPLTRSDPVLVRAVINGDTIDVLTVGRVRLLGIDAPEIGSAGSLGREARDRLAALVLHRFVRLEREAASSGQVSARRRAYVVREDGVFVNAVLVREGLARVSARMPVARLGELESAEKEARTYRRGLWKHTRLEPE